MSRFDKAIGNEYWKYLWLSEIKCSSRNWPHYQNRILEPKQFGTIVLGVHGGQFIYFRTFPGHYTLPGQNPVLQYVKTGDLAANLRLPEASNIFEDFPNRAVPLRNFRNRIFTNTDASIGELQSTKRPREEEDTLTSSKRTKLDTTSLKSVCHVCHFKLRKNNVKKRCFCKKLVHHSCFLANGSMCK